MRYRKNVHWKKDSAFEGVNFLTQRIEELTFDYSMDSYKARTLNAPFLCLEAIHVNKLVTEEKIDVSNFETVLDELRLAITSDFVAKGMLDTDLSKLLLNPEEKGAKRNLRLEVLQSKIEPYTYVTRCFELVMNAVLKPKNKTEINFLAETIVTTLVSLGMSKDFIFAKLRESFFDVSVKDLEPLASLDGFLRAIEPLTHKFSAVFRCEGFSVKDGRGTNYFGLALPDEAEPLILKQIDKLEINEKQSILILKKFSSLDYYSARVAAEAKLEKFRDFHLVFDHQSKFCWDEKVLIVQHCCGEQSNFVEMPISPMKKRQDIKPAHRKIRIQEFMVGSSLSDSASAERVDRAIDFHALSMLSESPESQLINLWVGFETLVPSDKSTTKIGTVIKSVKPFISVSYIFSVLRQLVIDLKNWDRLKVKELLNGVPNSEKYTVLGRCLLLVSLGECEGLRNKLYEALSDFYLLRFRVWSISEKFRSPAHTLEWVVEHEKRVEWQIRRIYRSRNMIVHEGYLQKNISSLIENAHDYFDQTLNGVLELCVGPTGSRTIEQAFERKYLDYERMMSLLKGMNQFDEASIRRIFYPSQILKRVPRRTLSGAWQPSPSAAWQFDVS